MGVLLSGSGPLVQLPGRQVGSARSHHEPGMDEGPQPGMLLRARVVVDRGRVQRPHGAVVDGDEGDGKQEWLPVLVQGHEADHDKEVEVHLDEAAREVDEDGGAAQEGKPRCRCMQPPPLPRKDGGVALRSH